MATQRSVEPSQRQLRVGEQIRHILAETLQRGHFHSEELLDTSRVTVTEVRVSPDLKHAKAYVILLGGSDGMEVLLEALNAEAQSFQKAINRNTQLKFTPRVRFVHDDTFEHAQRIDELLHNIHYSDQDE